jgi:6-pyruvoyltetrahydropterin/6-carboxytetrahydropterin synthase
MNGVFLQKRQENYFMIGILAVSRYYTANRTIFIVNQRIEVFMYEIDIVREFSAAHCLRGYQGNCSALHGHNWAVQVFVRAKEVDNVGIAVDFRKLKQELDAILNELDHTNLNELDMFKDNNPTSELIAKYIYLILKEKINDSNVNVYKVRVCESPGSGASYFE